MPGRNGIDVWNSDSLLVDSNYFYRTDINNVSNSKETLIEYDKLSTGSRINYISWINFLFKNHNITNNLTLIDIDNIIKVEKENCKNRNIYRTEKDISNFRSTLNKYYTFLKSNIEDNDLKAIETKIQEINDNQEISITEKSIIIQARVGQGKFRSQLINYWHSCSATTFPQLDILIASHIKPWKNSNNFERIDVYNGLLLLPNYDKLFDRGYINFDKNGKILISKLINDDEIEILGIKKDAKLFKLENEYQKYLDYHRKNCFMR